MKHIKKMIKITTIIMFSLMIIMILGTCNIANATVKNITKYNYLSYEKPIKDLRYGYNKGEAKFPYRFNEEYFYNRSYDHWNVDLVYDSTIAHSLRALKDRKTNEQSYKLSLKKVNKKTVKKVKKSITVKQKIKKRLHKNIDRVKKIDGSKMFKWYAYYVYADGDIYVITFKNGKIQKCFMLN